MKRRIPVIPQKIDDENPCFVFSSLLACATFARGKTPAGKPGTHYVTCVYLRPSEIGKFQFEASDDSKMTDIKMRERLMKERLKDFQKHVRPVELLPDLSCLTKVDKEKIIAESDREGPTIANYTLVDRLGKREHGFLQFVKALKANGLYQVALLLDPEDTGKPVYRMVQCRRFVHCSSHSLCVFSCYFLSQKIRPRPSFSARALLSRNTERRTCG